MIQSRKHLNSKFLNGMYPPQEDFHDWQDSYWHKNDQLPGMDAKAVEYNQQDLSDIVLTPFKNHLSVNKMDVSVLLTFQPMDGIVGKIMLLIQNIADTDIMVTIPELPALINMEESNEIVLSPGAFTEILVDGYGDYQTMKYRIKKISNTHPPDLPEYPKDEEKTMYLETIAQYQVYGNDWDASEWNFQRGAPNKGTYPYIRIGEYEWMTKNLKLVPVEGRIWNAWINTQANIDAYVNTGGADAMTLKQSLEYEGAFLGGNMGGNEVDALFQGTTFYKDSSKSQQIDGWKQPSVADFAQLFAMSDTLNFEDVIKFLTVEKGNSKYPFQFDWQNVSKNKSGFSAIPCGTRNNGNGLYRLPRNSIGFKTAPDDGYVIRIEPSTSGQPVSIIADNHENLNSVYPNTSIKFYLMSVRYCRPLSDQELGYRLYIDEANDTIQVVSTNSVQPNLTELQKGRLRGRAARWMNEEKTKVLAPLSQLKQEIEISNTGAGSWFGFDNV